MITALAYRTPTIDLRLLAFCLLAVLALPFSVAAGSALVALLGVLLPILGKLAIGGALIYCFAMGTKRF